MGQIALPLAPGAPGTAARIVVGNANRAALEAMAAAPGWPFRTAILFGPARSGKSLIARWFAESGAGAVIDDADRLDETGLLPRWNAAQESAAPLLLTCGRAEADWRIGLPDLASRLGAALHLRIGAPDDAMLADLIALHAEGRGLALGPEAARYLAARMERSHAGAERLVAVIDRLSLERKAAPTLSLWRDALAEIMGPDEPRLL